MKSIIYKIVREPKNSFVEGETFQFFMMIINWNAVLDKQIRQLFHQIKHIWEKKFLLVINFWSKTCKKTIITISVWKKNC